jgi:hypothetical protein
MKRLSTGILNAVILPLKNFLLNSVKQLQCDKKPAKVAYEFTQYA